MAVPSCPNGFLYTVVSGDTMFLIAKRFGVSLNALIAANPQVANPDLIFPGQVLCVPTGPTPPVPPFPPPPPTCSGFFYTVVSGDTMFLIAKRFGVSLSALIAANPQVTNPDLIFPGQVLCIPSVTPPTPPPPPATCSNFYYTVLAGETLSSISTKFGVRVSDILAANPQIPPGGTVVAGQIICIPLPPPPAACTGTFYTVKAGDTLTSIATAFGVSVNAILAANPQIINANIIYAGQVICIPTTPPPPPPPPPPTCSNFYYSVMAGETLSSISTKFGVRVSDILAANPQIPPGGTVVAGQIICIPLPPPPPTCSGTYYTVVGGDTLAGIAAKFHRTQAAILAANPQIINPNIIYAGQVICIPAAGSGMAADDPETANAETGAGQDAS